jgi:hypothetical protein
MTHEQQILIMPTIPTDKIMVIPERDTPVLIQKCIAKARMLNDHPYTVLVLMMMMIQIVC